MNVAEDASPEEEPLENQSWSDNKTGREADDACTPTPGPTQDLEIEPKNGTDESVTKDETSFEANVSMVGYESEKQGRIG
jgi:hypothetical protein